jgi:hypothetical protein
MCKGKFWKSDFSDFLPAKTSAQVALPHSSPWLFPGKAPGKKKIKKKIFITSVNMEYIY